MQYLDKLKQLKTEAKKEFDKINLGKIYGSRVNGDCRDYSDLDIAVKDFHNKDCSVSELKEILNNSNIPFLIDIHNYNDLPQSFQKEILKNYVVLSI